MSVPLNGSAIDETVVGASRAYRPGLVLYSVAVVVGLVVLVVEGSANVGWLLMAGYFGLPLWLGLPVLWMILFWLDASGSNLRMSRRTWARWLGLPAMAVLCVSLAYCAIPFRLRFELSRSALDQAAVQVLSGRPAPQGQIGLFQADTVIELPNGVLLGDYSMSFIDTCGLAYASDGPPEGVYATLDLGGGWWLACEDF
jgi:hypothetical protein